MWLLLGLLLLLLALRKSQIDDARSALARAASRRRSNGKAP